MKIKMGCGCSSKEYVASKSRRALYQPKIRRMRVENRMYVRQAPIFTLLSTYRKDSSLQHLSVTVFSYLSFPETVRVSGVSR